VVEHYSNRAIAEQLIQIYQSVIETPKPRISSLTH
jgi:hypothetical protein